MPGPQRTPVIERLMARIEVDSNGCWIWPGARDKHGYGKIGSGGHDGVMVYTHRVTYEHEHGPTGLPLDHLCRVPSCCNPAHLEAVTQRENVLRGDHSYRDDGRPRKCPRGHNIAPGTADVLSDGRCRQCNLAWRKARYEALRSQGLSGREAARRS